MITNDDLITEYTTKNKIYIPQAYNSPYWTYTISGNEITIITNQNCYQNYNSTYCDCYRYNEQYNIITESYSCNSNASNYVINHNNISSDINDSYRITREYANNNIILLLSIILAFIVVIVFKKNSRRI